MSNKVMLVDESETRATWLKQALDEAGYDVVSLVKGMDDLHQLVLDLQPDVVIIQSLSAKRDTLESLGCRNSQYPRPVVMLTEHNDPALMQAAQRAGISPYAVAGLSPAGVQSIINVAINQFQQHEELRHQLVDAETRLANQRVLEQAKCMMMEREGMSENAAYHLLRKTAMSHGRTLPEIARAFLKVNA